MTYRLVTRLAQSGHHVVVVTMNNGYMDTNLITVDRAVDKISAGSQFGSNLEIHSCSSSRNQHKSVASRIFFYAKYTMFVFKYLLFCKNTDIIFCSSPPIFHSVPAIIFAHFRRVPVLLEVRDLWPRSLIEMGLVKSNLNIWALRLIERFTYRGSERIVCYTEGIYKDISRLTGESKLDLIHCGVDLTSLNPNDKLNDSIVESLGLTGKKIVLYFGALGYANNIPFILKAAENLKRDSNIHFVLIGDGVAKEDINTFVNNNYLNNISILPPVPKFDAAKYINIATVCLVTLLERPVFSGAIPTKMIDYMACAKPVVSNVQGEAAKLLSISGAGITTNPYDIESFVSAISQFCYDPDLASRLGALGRKYVEKEFSIEDYLSNFEISFRKTLNGD